MHMPFIDTSKLPMVERLPGWRGRYFDSPSMTFAHYEFDAGSSIHEHSHTQEEVYEVIEGELELTIDGVAAHCARATSESFPPTLCIPQWRFPVARSSSWIIHYATLRPIRRHSPESLATILVRYLVTAMDWRNCRRLKAKKARPMAETARNCGQTVSSPAPGR